VSAVRLVVIIQSSRVSSIIIIIKLHIGKKKKENEAEVVSSLGTKKVGDCIA
jgi:hypothetical protein